MEELIDRIDILMFDIDTYGYKDNCDSREEGREQTKEYVLQSTKEELLNWLAEYQELITPEQIEIIKELIDKYK